MAEEFINKVSFLGNTKDVDGCLKYISDKIFETLTEHPDSYGDKDPSERVIFLDLDITRDTQFEENFCDYLLSDYLMLGENICLVTLRNIRTRRDPLPLNWIKFLGDIYPDIYIEYRKFGDCSGLTHGVSQNNEMKMLRKRDLLDCSMDDNETTFPLLQIYIPSLISN